MIFTDIPSLVSTGKKITAAWMNKLLDAVRRRTPIQGRGIRLTTTPNGTIISLSGNNGGNVSIEGQTKNELYPFKTRFVTLYDENDEPYESFEIYIPRFCFEILVSRIIDKTTVGVGQDAVGWDYERFMPWTDSSELVVNDLGSDADWYRIGDREDKYFGSSQRFAALYIYIFSKRGDYGEITAPNFKFHIRSIYGTGITPTGYTYQFSTLLAGITRLPYDTGTPYPSDGIGYVGTVYPLIRGKMYAEWIRFPRYGSELMLSTNNNSITVEGAIAALSNAIGGTGATNIPTPYSGNMAVDGGGDGTGDAGSSSSYSRGDHSHPLNVPEDGAVETTDLLIDDEESEDGTSPHYARADHVHSTADLIETDPTFLERDYGSGGIGTNYKFAPISHFHPANFDENEAENGTRYIEIFDDSTGATGLTPEQIEASVGVSENYARSDHTHWLFGVAQLGETGATMQADSVTGSGGNSEKAARLDHSHPLNVGGTGESGAANAIHSHGETGSFGTGAKYARQDHVHPFYKLASRVGGICGFGMNPPQTVICPPTWSSNIVGGGSGGATLNCYLGASTGMGTNLVSIYGGTGNAISQWSRDRDYSSIASEAGAYICTCEKIAYDNDNGRFIGFFRTLRFDAAGCLRSISAPKAYIVAPQW